MERKFTITGCHYKENCLPSLNDLLNKSPFEYNSIKKRMENIVMSAIAQDLKGYKAKGRIKLDITWGEKKKGRLRDFDNIVAAGRKIINDAMVKRGVIKDDNPHYLGYGNNCFCYTSDPFITVVIVEEKTIVENVDK